MAGQRENITIKKSSPGPQKFLKYLEVQILCEHLAIGHLQTDHCIYQNELYKVDTKVVGKLLYGTNL